VSSMPSPAVLVSRSSSVKTGFYSKFRTEENYANSAETDEILFHALARKGALSQRQGCDGRAPPKTVLDPQLPSATEQTITKAAGKLVFCRPRRWANWKALHVASAFMKTEQQPSNLTVEQCEELAASLLEDAAALPTCQKQKEILKLAGDYHNLAKIKRLVLRKVN
jgi:hypothetical protein